MSSVLTSFKPQNADETVLNSNFQIKTVLRCRSILEKSSNSSACATLRCQSVRQNLQFILAVGICLLMLSGAKANLTTANPSDEPDGLSLEQLINIHVTSVNKKETDLFSSDGKKISRLDGLASESMITSISSLLEGDDGDLFVTSQGQAGWVNNYYDVRMVYRDSKGGIWFASTRAGLYIWQAGALSKFPDPALDDVVISAVVVDQRGVISVGTSIGLLQYHAQFQRLTHLLATTETHALLVDQHGVLWVGTGGSGLLRCEGEVVTQFQKSDGLADDFVTALAEGHEGNLWIGTRNGLSQLSDVKIPTFGKTEGLTGDVNVSVVPSRLGGMWVANSSGFTHFDGGTNIQAYSAEIGLTHTYIISMLEAKESRPAPDAEVISKL
jgi:ligand-binding sensor domain-containing protein